MQSIIEDLGEDVPSAWRDNLAVGFGIVLVCRGSPSISIRFRDCPVSLSIDIVP